MGIEQRRYERYPVHLAVTYSTAASFVAEYAENLSIGGLFVAGAHYLERLSETEVTLELPGRGRWTVRAKVVFVLDEAVARQAGRKPGAGMEIVFSPPGFDDALLGYLLHLGRRREVVVMMGEVPGAARIADAGYRIVPLVEPERLAAAIAHAVLPIIAVVVPRSQYDDYTSRAVAAGAGSIVFAPTNDDEAADMVATIDSLL